MFLYPIELKHTTCSISRNEINLCTEVIDWLNDVIGDGRWSIKRSYNGYWSIATHIIFHDETHLLAFKLAF
jgi:hypothetical protein